VNGRPGYRCRHGYTSARPREASGPKFLYIRGDRLLAELLAHVGGRGREGPMEIVSALRANGLVIVCHASTRIVTEFNTEGPTSQGGLFMGYSCVRASTTGRHALPTFLFPYIAFMWPDDVRDGSGWRPSRRWSHCAAAPGSKIATKLNPAGRRHLPQPVGRRVVPAQEIDQLTADLPQADRVTLGPNRCT
jgi:hypothetical protein